MSGLHVSNWYLALKFARKFVEVYGECVIRSSMLRDLVEKGRPRKI